MHLPSSRLHHHILLFCAQWWMSWSRAHFNLHSQRPNKSRDCVEQNKLFKWFIIYYRRVVRSHSCSQVNSNISSEVVLRLIKSEETGSSGKYSCRPPPAQATRSYIVRFYSSFRRKQCQRSRVYIILSSHCSPRGANREDHHIRMWIYAKGTVWKASLLQ